MTHLIFLEAKGTFLAWILLLILPTVFTVLLVGHGETKFCSPLHVQALETVSFVVFLPPFLLTFFGFSCTDLL